MAAKKSPDKRGRGVSDEGSVPKIRKLEPRMAIGDWVTSGYTEMGRDAMEDAVAKNVASVSTKLVANGYVQVRDLPDTEQEWVEIATEMELPIKFRNVVKKQWMTPAEDAGSGPLTWSTPTWPPQPANMVDRGGFAVIEEYFLKILDRNSDAWDKSGKAKILTTLGTKGIGKTVLLVYALLVLASRKMSRKVACVYATFNGYGRYEDGDPLSTFLLKSAGMDRDHARRERNATDALNAIREHLALKDSDVLVVAIDELCDLTDENGQRHDARATAIIHEAMRLQDAFCHQDRPVVFLWSSLTERYIRKRASDSGRAMYDKWIPLRSLPWEECVQIISLDLMEYAKGYAGIRQLVLECMGHPRSLCDGLEQVKAEILSIALEPTVAQLQKWRTAIMEVSKFLNVPVDIPTLRWWFGRPCVTVEGGRIDEEKLRVGGILHQDPTGSEHILPMLLRQWAAENQDKTAMAYHLNRMYDCDCTLTATNEKEMEDVMVNFDAVRRIAVGDTVCALGDYYAAAKVDPQLVNKMVRVRVPDGQCHVRVFDDFNARFAEDIINALKEGYIVVTEQGLEYLVPFLHQGQLWVAVVQCKFVQTEVAWGEIRDKLKGSFTDTLDGTGIKWFLVAYTTADLKYVQPGTTQNAVCYYEANLFDYTRPAGVLRLHLEKLGSRLKQQCPWLAGVTKDDDE